MSSITEHIDHDRLVKLLEEFDHGKGETPFDLEMLASTDGGDVLNTLTAFAQAHVDETRCYRGPDTDDEDVLAYLITGLLTGLVVGYRYGVEHVGS